MSFIAIFARVISLVYIQCTIAPSVKVGSAKPVTFKTNKVGEGVSHYEMVYQGPQDINFFHIQNERNCVNCENI